MLHLGSSLSKNFFFKKKKNIIVSIFAKLYLVISLTDPIVIIHQTAMIFQQFDFFLVYVTLNVHRSL